MVKLLLTNMNIKEIEFRKDDENISVRIAVNPFDQDDLKKLRERRESTVRSLYLPFAIVTQKDQAKIFIGDARSHEELRQAVERDGGKLSDNDVKLGQAWLSKDCKIHDLFLVSYDNDNEEEFKERINFLFNNIRPELFYLNEVAIRCGSKEQYVYNIRLKSIVK